MKKIIGLILLSFLIAAGCSQNNANLQDLVNSFVKESDGNEIYLNRVIVSEWDQAFLFTPYTAEEAIKEQIGADYQDKSNISMRDDIYLLVILNNKKVVESVEMKRYEFDFYIEEKEFLTPKHDVIFIKKQ